MFCTDKVKVRNDGETLSIKRCSIMSLITTSNKEIIVNPYCMYWNDVLVIRCKDITYVVSAKVAKDSTHSDNTEDLVFLEVYDEGHTTPCEY